VKHPKIIESLPNGNAVGRSHHSVIREGNQFFIYQWDLAGVRPPNGVRIALFSYTVPAKHVMHFENLNEIEEIHNLVVQTQISKDRGVQGSYLPND